jgi:type I restriction enzyme S subunit
MERYSEYKDSGIFWNKTIPSHWEVRRLGHILVKERRERPVDAELLVCTNKATVVKKGDSKMGLVSDTDDIYQGVCKGDLLIHGMDTWHGAIAVSTLDGMCTPVVHVCTSKESVKYVEYYLRNMAQNKVFKLISNGVRQNTSDFRSWNKVAPIPCFLPPYEEQLSIVSYLDDKCANIDKMLEGKQKQIELLAEMKQRIIADAVTRGLNPNVEMKTTNIPWLPEIPEHWTVKPIRAILRENNEKTETGTEELLSLSQYTGVSRKRDAGKTGMFEAESTIGYKKVHSGQFVMNIMLAWNGSYAVSGLEGIISPAYCVFDFISNDNKMYYNYLWRLGVYQGAFKTESRGIIDSRLRLYPNKFLPFPTICPPLKEQNAIVNYINEKVVKIDTLTSKLQQEIESIKEYKQRLISDVVTGQIKVC